MDAIIAVTGTLVGTALGILGAYVINLRVLWLSEQRRTQELRRTLYLGWLDNIAVIYYEIHRIHRDVESGKVTRAEATGRLRDVPTANAQASLEGLRLACGDAVNAAASGLWSHLRREAVPAGELFERADRATWQDAYWDMRRDYINIARNEPGLPSLDWRLSGVGRPSVGALMIKASSNPAGAMNDVRLGVLEALSPRL